MPDPPSAERQSRAPRAVPAKHAFEWFAEAMRLWKRGPWSFSVMALVLLVVSVVLEPVPIAGFVAANVLAPLLATGLLYASLAADRCRPHRTENALHRLAKHRCRIGIVRCGDGRRGV